MKTRSWHTACIIALILLSVPGVASAASEPAYTTTYTITVEEDGTAFWQVEYRTLLATDADRDAFDAYTRDLSSVYLPQIKDLMQRSAAQSAVSTSRHMEIKDVSGDTVIQTSPTGRFGIIIYTFRWTGFAEPGSDLTIGDAFAGGMYLAKDNTLIIRYPSGYTVLRAEPQPDQQRDGLIWYGQRAFGAGEPFVVLQKTTFPLVPAGIGLFLVVGIISVFLFYRLRKSRNTRDELDEPDVPAAPLSKADEENLEVRIVQLLRANGGELYQSEIVRVLDIPKSTASSAINILHQEGIILKVKKGRENLIRLADKAQ